MKVLAIADWPLGNTPGESEAIFGYQVAIRFGALANESRTSQ